MNSGGKLWQSGSRTGETVATHCNVQTAPYAARAVHFGLLQSSRNLSRQCYTISATSRTWMHGTVSCLNCMTQQTDPPTGGARRYTEAYRPTQGTARQAAPFAHPTHKHLYEEAHNLSRARCAATRNRQHTIHQRACRFGHQNDMRAYYTQPQPTDTREPIERPRRPIGCNAEPKMKANRLKAAVGAGIRGRVGARRNQVWSPACPWANSASPGSSQNTPARPTEQSGGSRN